MQTQRMVIGALALGNSLESQARRDISWGSDLVQSAVAGYGAGQVMDKVTTARDEVHRPATRATLRILPPCCPDR